MTFEVEPTTVVYPDGPPHFGKSYDAWRIKANIIEAHFKFKEEAQKAADALNKALAEAVEDAWVQDEGEEVNAN